MDLDHRALLFLKCVSDVAVPGFASLDVFQEAAGIRLDLQSRGIAMTPAVRFHRLELRDKRGERVAFEEQGSDLRSVEDGSIEIDEIEVAWEDLQKEVGSSAVLGKELEEPFWVSVDPGDQSGGSEVSQGTTDFAREQRGESSSMGNTEKAGRAVKQFRVDFEVGVSTQKIGQVAAAGAWHGEQTDERVGGGRGHGERNQPGERKDRASVIEFSWG